MFEYFEFKTFMIEPSSGDVIKFNGVLIADGGTREVFDPYFAIYKTESKKWVVVREIKRDSVHFIVFYENIGSGNNLDENIYREVFVCNSKEEVKESLKAPEKQAEEYHNSGMIVFNNASKKDPELRGRNIKEI